MAKGEVLKYDVLINDNSKVCDSVLITSEQEKLLLWLIEKDYIDDDYCTFCKITSMGDITDLT
jgi:hypothetical protein